MYPSNTPPLALPTRCNAMFANCQSYCSHVNTAQPWQDVEHAFVLRSSQLVGGLTWEWLAPLLHALP